MNATDGKTYINTNMGGLYPGSPSLIKSDNVDGPEAMNSPTIPRPRPPPSVLHPVSISET